MTSCDMIQDLPIPNGMTSASATGNNMGAPANLEPMTSGCRTNGDTGSGGEVVYRVTIPGSGNLQLTASTDDPATDPNTDTLLYIQTQCGGGQELACNDDTATAIQSTAIANVTGGQTVFVIVDSYNAAGAGAFKLNVSIKPIRAMGENCDPTGAADVCASGLICTPPTGTTHTCTMGTAPTLAKAELIVTDDPNAADPGSAWLYISGSDPDGDITGISAVWKDASGNVLGMTSGPSPITVPAPGVSFTAMPLGLTLTTMNGDAGNVIASSLDLQLFDSLGHMSSLVNVTPLQIKNLTQSCSATIDAPDQCRHELVCGSGNTCQAGTAETAACTGATTVTPGTPVSDTIAASSADQFEGSCFYTPRAGGEKVYKVTVAAPTSGQTGHDVIASTVGTGTFDSTTMVDTYVYIRSTCADPSSEVACNDDTSSSEYRSTATGLNLAAGTYFVFVDTSSAGTGPNFTLNVTLRPVLATGQTCDPQGVTNRCHGAACPTTGTAVCP
jgi:hypothetical protein